MSHITCKDANMRTSSHTFKAVLVSAAVALLLAGCSGSPGGDASEAPTGASIGVGTEVQSVEVDEVEETRPAESVDVDVNTIDFDAITDADTALWTLILRAEEAQGATRGALLTAVEDDLNALTDAVLSAMDSSVANLNFGQISDADTAAWSLLLRAGEAGELIDVAPIAQRILEGLDQAGATLVTTADPNDANKVDTALWSLNLRVQEAQELLDSSTH